ncbi:MAG: murein biosynthesis integral membrane protein MurJ [Desulfobacteraceae bacterium]|jgi:putative peptidoglycan lipid II flippase
MTKTNQTNKTNQPSEHERVTRAAGVVGSATLFSRILGYVRDMVIASLFGAGLVSDAFIVAFRIPNLLRRLFGEGSLSIAFVPVFTDCLNHKGRDEAEQLALSSLRSLLVLLVLGSVMGIILTPVIVHLLAYGFTEIPEKFALCVKLTRIMIPYSLFIGLVALCMGILNVLGHFAAPAMAPALLNIAMIGMVTIFAWLSPSSITRSLGLALGVLMGGVLQLGLQVPFLIKNGIRVWRSVPFWHPDMKQVLVLMGPTLFGAAVYQINNLVICLLGSLLPQGSVSYLYYADRLVQFPLGVFAIAMATAVFPTLSHQASMGQMEALQSSFIHALQLVFFITLPAMVGLIVLREPIVAILFQRGAFDGQTTRLTAGALLYYGIGLWAFAAVRILIYTFYALKDTRTPVKIALGAITANIILGTVLMQSMRHNGLALALSLASMLHLMLLALALRKKMGAIGWRKLARSLVRTSVCAFFMGLCVRGVAGWILPPEEIHTIGLLVGLIICIIAGIIVFGGLAFIIKAPELNFMHRLFAKRTVST